MNGKQLKNSILQWAIQGRLVPQDPTDEPASVLLQRIQAEKAKLVKEGKLKKAALRDSRIFRGEDNKYYEKVGKTITCIDKDIPFEIPETWEWVRLGSVVSTSIGKTPERGHQAYWSNGIYNWVAIADMIDGGIINSTKEQVSQIAADNCFGDITPAGSLIMSFKLTIGRTSILGCDAYHNEAIVTIRPYIDTNNALRNYLLHIMPKIANSGDAKEAIKGKTLNSKSIFNLLLPLPPLAEQHRIVAKVEEVLSVVERYEKAQDALDALCNSLDGRLRKSILSEAIQGHLVPQDPTDEPASVLLQRIQAEKAKLVKEGKLKKSALSDSRIFRGEDNKYYEKVGKTITCIDEDIPFEIPQTWEWVRLGDVCQLMDGERRTGKALCLDAKYLRGKSAGTYMNEGKFVRKGDNIILVDGENSGEVFSVPTDGYMGSTFKQLWLCPHAHLPYLLLFILFNKQNLRDNKRGAAIPHLRKELFFNLLLPLPPLAEQHRIVAKVEEVFAVLDGLAGK